MPAKDWKYCEKVRVVETRAGTKTYVVRDHYTNRQKKILGPRSFPTLESADKYRIEHNARLKKRDGNALVVVDEATAFEEAAVRRRLGRMGISGLEAFQHAEKHMKPRKGNVDLRELYKIYLVERSQVKGRYKVDFNRVVEVLVGEFGKKPINEIEPDDIRKCFDKMPWKSSTRNPREQKVKTLWKWAYEKGYTTKLIHKTYEKVSLDHTGVRAHSPYVVQGLLNCAVKHKLWDMVFSLALTSFVGFRREETARFDWDHIRWGENAVWLPRELVKGRTKIRSAEITPNLRKWLLLAKANHLKLPVKVSKLDSQWKELKQFYLVENPNFDYEQNTNRHSFCGYALAIGKSVDEVAQLMNNEPKKLLSKYKELVSKQEAEFYWTIEPPKKYTLDIEKAWNQLRHQSTLNKQDVPLAMAQLEQLLEHGKLKLAEKLSRNINAWRDPDTGECAEESFQWHPSHPEVQRTTKGVLVKLWRGGKRLDVAEFEK